MRDKHIFLTFFLSMLILFCIHLLDGARQHRFASSKKLKNRIHCDRSSIGKWNGTKNWLRMKWYAFEQRTSNGRTKTKRRKSFINFSRRHNLCFSGDFCRLKLCIVSKPFSLCSFALCQSPLGHTNLSCCHSETFQPIRIRAQKSLERREATLKS